jgi:hypothetical protein
VCGGIVDGSGSTCFGSHDAQRDNDQSTAGSGDANRCGDGGLRAACGWRQMGWLSWGRDEVKAGIVAGGQTRSRAATRLYDVSGQAGRRHSRPGAESSSLAVCPVQCACGKGEQRARRRAAAALGTAGWRRQQRAQGARSKAAPSATRRGTGGRSGWCWRGGRQVGVSVVVCRADCPGGRGGNQAANTLSAL